jgi:hypothetical protein
MIYLMHVTLVLQKHNSCILHDSGVAWVSRETTAFLQTRKKRSTILRRALYGVSYLVSYLVVTFARDHPSLRSTIHVAICDIGVTRFDQEVATLDTEPH